MNLLLDTHLAVWLLVDDPRLSAKAREMIADPGHAMSVSVVSIWEIAIKHALDRTGESAMPIPARVAKEALEQSGYGIVPVKAAHALEVENLPRLLGDPFDRLLLAQAIAEPFRLLTHDRKLAAYGDAVIVV